VDGGRGFELEGLGRGGALALQRREQTCAMRAKRLEDSVGFSAMAVRRASLVTRRQALLHFEVRACRVLGIRVQIFHAAAQLKEVEHSIAGTLCSSARGEGAEAAIRCAADITIGREEAREVVLQRHAQICWRPQPEPFAYRGSVFCGEGVDDLSIEQQ
jgi:hypothetical protein